MVTKETNRAKIEKPRGHFEFPRRVVADPLFSKRENDEVLQMHEQDAQLLSTAADEGMTGGEDTNLHDVRNAQELLKRRTAAPTPGSESEVAAEVEIEKLDP